MEKETKAVSFQEAVNKICEAINMVDKDSKALYNLIYVCVFAIRGIISETFSEEGKSANKNTIDLLETIQTRLAKVLNYDENK